MIKTDRASQRDMVLMLKDADRKFGRENLQGLLPGSLRLTGGNHDTGCQFSIQSVVEGYDTLNVWIGSVWYSSEYNFNDRDKILGMQPDFESVRSAIEKFFDAVTDALEAAYRKEEEDAQATEAAFQRRRAEALKAHIDAINGEKVAAS